VVEPRLHWLVTCSCGWERECASEWAAQSVSKLHPQFAPMDVAHMTRVAGPELVATRCERNGCWARSGQAGRPPER